MPVLGGRWRRQRVAYEVAWNAGYQVHFAETVRRDAAIATGAVGLITDAVQAESILQEGQADVILVARAAMRNPYFAVAAAKQLGEVIPWAPQLERARRIK